MAEAKKAKKSEPRVLSFKKRYLQDVCGWLSMPLHGKEARARNRFLRHLFAGGEALDQERMEVIKRLGVLDDEGNPKIEDETVAEGVTRKVYAFKSPEDRVTAEREIDEIRNEHFKLDITPAIAEDFAVVKKLILENVGTTVKFTFAETEIYDEACAAFEAA